MTAPQHVSELPHFRVITLGGKIIGLGLCQHYQATDEDQQVPDKTFALFCQDFYHGSKHVSFLILKGSIVQGPIADP